MLSAIFTVLGTAIVTCLGWVFMVGTRVSVLETKHADLMLLISTRFDESGRRLDRIEKAMNGLLVKH